MIELLKLALEALEDVGVLTDREWQAVHKNKANELRQAIAELESQEPVVVVDGDAHSIKVRLLIGGINLKPDTKLYTHPPQRTEQNFCPRCGKRTADLTTIHTCTPPQDEYMTLKEKVNLAMAWYDSGLEDRAAFQTLMESILAQPPQRTDYERGVIDGMQKQAQSSVDKAVKAMAQRTWVGLTDEEINEWTPEIHGVIQAIEAKLKEKNT